MKLSTRIAISVAVLVPLLVLGAGALVVRWARHDLTDRQDRLLCERADSLEEPARLLAGATGDDRAQVARTRQYRLFALALDVGLRLDTREGAMQVGPQPPVNAELPESAILPTTVRADGGTWRVVTRSVPAGRLWVFAPAEEPAAQADLLWRRVYLVTAFAVPLSGLAGLVTGTAATRSLRALRRRAALLDPDGASARGGPSAVHVPTGVVEVDELGRTLDDVFGRYAAQTARTRDALETARSFAATVDHELRGPLTGMRTDLDVLSGYPDLPADERGDVVADLRVGHERVLAVLAALRALARGGLVDPAAFGPVELGGLAHAAARDAVAGRPGADVRVEAAHEVVVVGLAAGLRLLVDNLVVNALVHGSGTVRIRVEQGVDCGLLYVDDEGPGIPPALRDAVFERFHRDPGSPGAGLGLTLVAQQAAVHGGRVSVGVPVSGRGTRVEVILPSSTDPRAAPDGDWLAQRPRAGGSREPVR